MNLSIREDTLSVQYSLASDPHFWIRVVKPVGQTLIVSDALQGSQSPEGMEKALAAVLTKHVDSNVNAITFANIAPSHPAEKTAQRRVADRFDHLSAAVRSWACVAGREVANGHLDLDHDSFAAVFRLT
jgi:hypothetical protein